MRAAQRIEQPAEQQRPEKLPAANGRMYQPTWLDGMPKKSVSTSAKVKKMAL